MIAPHQGRELALVLAGTKPMGSLQFVQYVDQMRSMKISKPFVVDTVHTPDGMFVIFSLDGDILKKYRELLLNERALAENGLEWYQRSMGKLFGYTEEEVDAFVSKEFKCNCANCKGMSRNDGVQLSRMQKTLRVRNNQYTISGDGAVLATNLLCEGLDLVDTERKLADIVDEYGEWL